MLMWGFFFVLFFKIKLNSQKIRGSHLKKKSCSDDENFLKRLLLQFLKCIKFQWTCSLITWWWSEETLYDSGDHGWDILYFIWPSNKKTNKNKMPFCCFFDHWHLSLYLVWLVIRLRGFYAKPVGTFMMGFFCLFCFVLLFVLECTDCYLRCAVKWIIVVPSCIIQPNVMWWWFNFLLLLLLSSSVSICLVWVSFFVVVLNSHHCTRLPCLEIDWLIWDFSMGIYLSLFY